MPQVIVNLDMELNMEVKTIRDEIRESGYECGKSDVVLNLIKVGLKHYAKSK